MSNATKFLLFAGAMILTILLIVIGFNVYKTTKPQTDSAMTQYTNMTSQYNDIEKTTYDNAIVTGNEVKACINNFAKDAECDVIVSTGAGDVTWYFTSDTYNKTISQTNSVSITSESFPAWLEAHTDSGMTITATDGVTDNKGNIHCEDPAEINTINATDAAYISDSGKFEGHVVRDLNGVIRLIAFEQMLN